MRAVINENPSQAKELNLPTSLNENSNYKGTRYAIFKLNFGRNLTLSMQLKALNIMAGMNNDLLLCEEWQNLFHTLQLVLQN